MALLPSLLRTWQPLLRLSHWRVTAEWAPPGELTPDQNALCIWTTELLHARILVRRPSRYVKLDYPVPYYVIHELLHLHFAPVYTDSKKVQIEQAIHSLALAFLSQK